MKGSSTRERVNKAPFVALKEALLAVLHNDNNDPSYVGLPRNSHALNVELIKRKRIINQLMKKGVLKKD